MNPDPLFPEANPRAAVFYLADRLDNRRRLAITVNEHDLLSYQLESASGIPMSLTYISEDFARSHPAFAGDGWVRDMEALLHVYCTVLAVQTPLPIS